MIIVDPLLSVIILAIEFYLLIVFVMVVVSWLVAFNVVNIHNRFVFLVRDFTLRATEPALRPIRRFLPNLGGIDISPVILILFLYFLQQVVGNIQSSLRYG